MHIDQIEIPVKKPTLWVTAGSESTVYPALYNTKRMESLEDFEKRIAPLMDPPKYKHALSAFPKKLHQIVDHGRSVCLQLDDIDITLSKLDADGQFLQQNEPGVSVEMNRKGTNFGRIGIRIPLDMLKQIKEALDGIESTNS
jgi:hypothetical protein